MGDFKVRDAATWKTPTTVYVRYGAAWPAIKDLYACEWGPGLDATKTGGYEVFWRYLKSYTPPEDPVPSVVFGRDSAKVGPSVHTVSWGTPVGRNVHFDVRVEWWVNGIRDYVQDVSPNTRNASRTYDVSDNVYCKVAYTNTAGTGPWTQTATI